VFLNYIKTNFVLVLKFNLFLHSRARPAGLALGPQALAFGMGILALARKLLPASRVGLQVPLKLGLVAD